MTENLNNLSDDELILRIRGGDGACMDALIERYKRQVRNQARPLYLIGGDSDDLIQEGMLGLFKAIRDYRTENNASFGAFAHLCISRQLYTAIQAAGRQKHAPLNSYVELSDEDLAGTSGILGEGPGPEDLIIDLESRQSLRDAIQADLSSMEREILSAYLDGMSYAEIAESVGRTPKSVDNAIQRIRRKLKRFMP